MSDSTEPLLPADHPLLAAMIMSPGWQPVPSIMEMTQPEPADLDLSQIKVGLTVGPDDVLVLTLPNPVDRELVDELAAALRIQLGDRFLIIAGDVELAVVRKEPTVA